MRKGEDLEGAAARDLERAVRRAVVAHQDLNVGVGHPGEGVQARTEPPLLVVGTDHDRQRRPGRTDLDRLSPGPAGRHVERGPRAAIQPGQAEAPPDDRFRPDRPLVGPREHRGAGAARRVDQRELHLQGPRLLGVPVHLRGEPELGEHQRPVLADPLQVTEVRRQLVGALEEHVERRQVLALDPEVLRGGVAGVGGQHVLVPRVDRVHQLGEGVLDRRTPVDPDDVGGHLVADRDGQHLRATRERRERLTDGPVAVAAHLPTALARRLGVHPPVVVAQAHQQTQAERPRGVEQVGRRHAVGADHGEPLLGDRGQVAVDLPGLREEEAVGPRCEVAVRDALDAVRRTPEAQVLAVGHHAFHGHP